MTNQNTTAEIFDRYAQNRKKLLGTCDILRVICHSLGQKAKAESIGIFRDKLNDDRFRIMVLGAFKRGKSTFINALLGAEILPNFATPCTAVINEVKWGNDKGVTIHFKQKSTSELPQHISTEVVSHIEKYRESDKIPPIDIAFDRLEEFVVIPDPAKDQAESITESPFEFAEIFWPLPLCKNGVELIDSPGLDEHESRTRVTEKYLDRTDVVLFVQSCSALAGKTEMNFIENQLLCNGFEETIFICNRFDEVKEKERQRIRDYAISKLGHKTKLKEAGIFFISSADALDGRLEDNNDMVIQSGIMDVEKSLFQFLVENRGKVKIIQPARKLLQESHSLMRELHNAIQLFNDNLDAVKVRAQSMQEQAATERKRVEQIRQRIDNMRLNIKADAEDKIYGFFNSTLADTITSELKDFVPENQLKFLSVDSTKTQAVALCKEVQTQIAETTEKTQAVWQKDVFSPFMERQLMQLGDSINDSVEDILKGIDKMRSDFVGKNNDLALPGNEASGLERLLSGLGGYIISGPGGLLMGGMFGYKEMLKNIVPSIGIIIGAIVLGVTNPWILIAALFGGGMIQGMLKMKSVTDKIKDNVVQKYVEELKSKAREAAKCAAEQVYEKTELIAERIEQALRAEIQSVVELADNAIQEHESGESQKKRRLLEMNGINEKLLLVQAELGDIIQEVAL